MRDTLCPSGMVIGASPTRTCYPPCTVTARSRRFQIKKMLLFVAASGALVACSHKGAQSAIAGTLPATSSSAPTIHQPLSPHRQLGVSGHDRASMNFAFSTFAFTCLAHMVQASLLSNGVTHVDKEHLSWEGLQADTDDTFAKSGATFRGWIEKLKEYPGVVASLKGVRAAQYGCSTETMIKIKQGSLDEESASAAFTRAYDRSKQNLNAELDAVPIAADKDGLNLSDGAE